MVLAHPFYGLVKLLLPWDIRKRREEVGKLNTPDILTVAI